VKNKIDDLHLLIEEESPDILGITESWLSSDTPDSFLRLRNYQIFRCDRSHGTEGYGGVLLAVRHNLNSVLVPHNTHHEVIVVNVKVGSSILRFVLVYRPPQLNHSDNASFVDFLSDKLRNCRNYIIFGDMNYPNINWTDYTTNCSIDQTFLDYVNEQNLVQVITEPTRERNILDVCLVSHEKLVKNAVVHERFSTSDHNFITCDILMFCQVEAEPTVQLDFWRADWESIHRHFAAVDWDTLLNCCDLDTMWARFKSLMEYVIELYVPTKVAHKHKYAPWSNLHIKQISQKKKQLWRKSKSSPTAYNTDTYKKYCKYVKCEVTEAKIKYERDKFSNRSISAKNFFNYVDSSTNHKTPIPTPNVNGEDLVTDSQKAEALCNQFQSVFTVDDGKLPDCEQKVPLDSLTTIEITHEDVFLALRTMKDDVSPGPDGLHPLFIKKLTCHFVKPLKILFQKSLSTGLLVNDWKVGTVVPVNKKNRKPRDPVSYRPICLTSVLSKLLEKVVHKYIVSFVSQNNLLAESQHGFISGRSTTTNLIDCLNDWTMMINEKLAVDVLYVDLAKAFDSVSHEKLLYKLKKIGFGGNLLNWFRNYLTDRLQRTKVGCTLSGLVKVMSGIPQGSNLGPLLFNIYINDVYRCIKNNAIKLYADDSKIYGRANDELGCISLWEDLRNVQSFFNEWQLKVNIDKCEVLHIGYNNAGFRYKLDDCVLPESSDCRDLGIRISDDLSVHKHCANIVRTCFFRLKQFNDTFVCKDRLFQVFLYKTYIRPLLEHNTPVWTPHLIGDIDSIERVQKRFTKRLPGLYNTPYRERLSILDIESLEYRRIVFDLILMYKIVNDLIDLPFDTLFQFNTNSTRGHSLKVQIKSSRVDCRKYFFANRVAPIWNSLPANVVTSSSLRSFKALLSNHDLSNRLKGRALMA